MLLAIYVSLIALAAVLMAVGWVPVALGVAALASVIVLRYEIRSIFRTLPVIRLQDAHGVPQADAA